MQIVDAIISHGCFLQECSVEQSIVGVRSRLDYGVELKVLTKVCSCRLSYTRRCCEGFRVDS